MYHFRFFTLLTAALVFASCASAPNLSRARKAALRTAAAQVAPTTPQNAATGVPPEVLKQLPPRPEKIRGKGEVPPEVLAEFLSRANPNVNTTFVKKLAKYYVREAAAEGINSDVAWCQMCLETGFLKYGGLVSLDMNNFCGLGSLGRGIRGESFATPEEGVRAHIQHLKAYATTEKVKGKLIDPRYQYVNLGSAPTIYGLSGTWAADPNYGAKIKNILDHLYLYNFMK
jgi:hypothetical protein